MVGECSTLRWGRREFLAGVGTTAVVSGLAGCAGPLGGGGDTYPDQPIQWWIPYGRGGGQDRAQRFLGPLLGEELGVSFAMKNVTGGAGGVAMQQLKDAEPDGYTTSGILFRYLYVMQAVHDFDYDPNELTFIYQFSDDPVAIGVHADSEWETLSDLIEAAPDSDLKSASVGLGTPHHLVSILLEEDLGLANRYVAFSGGGEVVSGVLGQRADFSLLSYNSQKPSADAGDLRILALLSPPRSENPALEGYAPDVPTLTEAIEVDDPEPFYLTTARGTVAPPGLPEERQQALVDAFEAVTSSDEWNQYVENNAHVAVQWGPEKAREEFDKKVTAWEPLIPKVKEAVAEAQN